MSVRARTAALLLLAAGLGAGCPPSPRGHCESDKDCAGGPAGLFCAEGVCQAPPQMTASFPSAAQPRAGTATVRAQVSRAHGGPDAATVRLSLGAATLTPVAEGGGSFRFDVPLALAPAGVEGAVPLHLTAADNLGHTTALDGALLVDDAPPSLSLAADTAWHPRAALEVSANVSDLTLDEGSVRLGVGGTSLAPSSVSGATHLFAVPASALPAGAEGPVALTLSARDQFGHAATSTGQLLVDDLAPRVTVDASTVPAAPVVLGTTVQVRVSVADASPVTVTAAAAGQALAVSKADATTFQIAVDTRRAAAADGMVSAEVLATDAAGNVGRAQIAFKTTRVKWSFAASPVRPIQSLMISTADVVVQPAGATLLLLSRETGTLLRSLSVGGVVARQPALSVDAFFSARTDNFICKVPLDGSAGWCCGPFGILDSSLALGGLASPDAATPITVFSASTGSSGSGGQRLIATPDVKDSANCNPHLTLPLANFSKTSPAIAADGTIYVGADDAVVAATFDGFAWSATVTPRPGEQYQAPTALTAAGPGGQGALFASTGGALDKLLFASPSSAPTTGFSAQASSGPTYPATGATIAADGTIVVGTANRSIVALRADGSVRWQTSIPGRPTAPPTQGDGGIVYAVDDFGTLTALSIADGRVLWTWEAKAALRTAPALGCDGTLYVGSDDGSVVALVTDSLGLADSPWPRAGRDNRSTGDARRKLRDASGACLE